MIEKVLIVSQDHSVVDLIEEEFIEQENILFRMSDELMDAVSQIAMEYIQWIVLDICFPKLPAIELCRQIKKLNPEAWVGAVIESKNTMNMDRLNEAGFDMIFVKKVENELSLAG